MTNEAKLDAETLTLIGEPGARATVLQISSGFCAPCRAARHVLNRVVDELPGVRYVEIDLAFHPEVAERMQIVETPTTFILDSAATVLTRFSGVPRLGAFRDLLSALAAERA